HTALHPGNLLLRLGPDGRPELYLIDIYAVRLGPPLDRRRSRDNLVVLNRWFALRASRPDRLRCWRAYCAARAAPGEPPGLSRRAGRHAVQTAGINPAARRAGVRAREIEGETVVSNLPFWRA